MQIYRIKILDFRYMVNFDCLSFKYLTYEVMAFDKEDAVKKARKCYMNEEEALFSEELPFLLKLSSVVHTTQIKENDL